MNRGHCLSIHDHIEGYKAGSVILTSAVNHTIPFLGKGSVSVPALCWSDTQSREVSMNATFTGAFICHHRISLWHVIIEARIPLSTSMKKEKCYFLYSNCVNPFRSRISYP